MTENELITHWNTARKHVIQSQLGPIFLLIVTVALLATGLAETPLPVRIAAAGILLASGILGSLAQFSAASEAQAVVDDLRELGASSAVSRRVIESRWAADIVRFVTPGIFVIIYLALLWALFL